MIPWPPRMLAVSAVDLPGKLSALATAAIEAGWAVWATYSEAVVDGEQVDTVVVRFAHGAFRCYGSWLIGETAKGAMSVKWLGGGRLSSFRMAPVDNLSTLTAHLGVAR